MPYFTFWKNKDSRTLIQKFATKVLKAGPIPKHVAVIMDGNRRYSKKRNISLEEGYLCGSNKLSELITWSEQFGISEVTTYAFSIENFKRSVEEQEILFRIFKKELEETIDDIESGGEIRCAFRFVGDWTMYPADLKDLMAELMLRTRHYSKFILSIAFAYTSRNEIARGAETLRKAILDGKLKVSDVTQELLGDVLQVHPTNPVDLLIRTSATFRLSDFMLWQSAESVLHFLTSEWPELSFWEFSSGIFKFQQQYTKIQEMRDRSRLVSKVNEESRYRQKEFVDELRLANWEWLEVQSNTS